jgi:hypothetical protein
VVVVEESQICSDLEPLAGEGGSPDTEALPPRRAACPPVITESVTVAAEKMMNAA